MRFASVVVVGVLLGGPAALAAQERTTVGGYGEVHYTNPTGPNTPATVNLRRFVVYLAHDFNDRLAFRSELEIEDAKIEAGSAAGEVALEQAFLDGRVAQGLTLRAGLLLVPVGIINETHEPPTFNGVNRPDFDHDIIPTTWREIGVGAAGTLPGGSGLSYRLYLVNGLRADGLNQWNANLVRELKITEQVRLQLRADAINLQNRSQMNPPDVSPTSTNFGRVTSQTSSLNRFYQVQMRLTF